MFLSIAVASTSYIYADTRLVMSHDDVDAFVESAKSGALTPSNVTAAVAMGIPVNGQHSRTGWTALQHAVGSKRHELVAALLAAGADPNVKDYNGGWSAVFYAAWGSTSDILQLLINSKGSVNQLNDLGQSPLIGVVKLSVGDAAARLRVLLSCSELDLDTTYEGKTAEEWATHRGYHEFAAAIADEVSGSAVILHACSCF